MIMGARASPSRDQVAMTMVYLVAFFITLNDPISPFFSFPFFRRSCRLKGRDPGGLAKPCTQSAIAAIRIDQ